MVLIPFMSSCLIFLMRISLNDVWLTNDGVSDLQSWTDAHGVLLNGQQVVQDAQFLRATSAQPMARGNAVNVLQFSVTRQHVSVAEAAAYVLTTFNTLPPSGAAGIVCGASGESFLSATFTAVLAEMPKCSFSGTRSELTFVLRGGAITMGPPLTANGIDGGALTAIYANAQGGSIDGGNMADAFAPVALNLDGGGLI
jgi:hypothetical protein